MSRLDPLLVSALEALTTTALADEAERRRWQRLAEGTHSLEARDAARTRADRAVERARGTAAMRLRLISGEATVMEAESWITACEENR